MTQSIDRREFLRRSVAGISVAGISTAGTFPIFLGKTARALGAADPRDDRILVVLQLSGGNDGLSTVVPYSDPAYGRARSTTRLGEKDVLRIDERVGLHPNLKELKEVYDQGNLAIIQGASYPNPNRSHFESMDIWHAGGREMAREGTGWLGRAIDSTCGNRPDPLLAVNVGGKVHRALLGREAKPVAFSNLGAYRWQGRPKQESVFEAMNRPGEPGSAPEQLGELDFLRRTAADARSSSETLRKAALNYRPSREYPGGNRLAADLRTVAGLIAARLPTRVFYVSLGGFDTHANQRGPHDNLMRTVSQAAAAFLKDLEAQGALDRVLILSFSEFGRRVKENGSRGTDHGVAAPMFLMGSKVRGGLHGRHPSLTELVNGDLAMTVDFRQAYATVLDGWLGIPSEKVLGKRHEAMPLLGNRRRAF